MIVPMRGICAECSRTSFSSASRAWSGSRNAAGSTAARSCAPISLPSVSAGGRYRDRRKNAWQLAGSPRSRRSGAIDCELSERTSSSVSVHTNSLSQHCCISIAVNRVNAGSAKPDAGTSSSRQRRTLTRSASTSGFVTIPRRRLSRNRRSCSAFPVAVRQSSRAA